MAIMRFILEMGTGNDIHGEDYNKAAVRAVQDALHHSSITFFKSLGIDRNSMMVEVTVGVQAPDEIDAEVIRQQIPYGSVTVSSVKGGLNVIDKENDSVTVIATAAVAARLEIPEGKYHAS